MREIRNWGRTTNLEDTIFRLITTWYKDIINEECHTNKIFLDSDYRLIKELPKSHSIRIILSINTKDGQRYDELKIRQEVFDYCYLKRGREHELKILKDASITNNYIPHGIAKMVNNKQAYVNGDPKALVRLLYHQLIKAHKNYAKDYVIFNKDIQFNEPRPD